VTNMQGMFDNATSFNQPIHKWGIQPSDILTDMFTAATAFHTAYSGSSGFGNTPTLAFFNKTSITQANIQIAVDAWVADPTTAEATYGHIRGWDVSAVTDMNNLFNGKQSFNDDISNWDVSNVTNMSEMFYNAYVFNQPIGDWNVSSVTNMYQMFYGAFRAFNQPLANWERTAGVNGATSTSTLSNVTHMGGMFQFTQIFNQPIGNWDTSNVQYMGDMFWQTSFNQDISSWDTSNVKSMQAMFRYNSVFNQNIGNWKTSKVTNMGFMFSEATEFNNGLQIYLVGIRRMLQILELCSIEVNSTNRFRVGMFPKYI
jgi:surface protein